MNLSPIPRMRASESDAQVVPDGTRENVTNIRSGAKMSPCEKRSLNCRSVPLESLRLSVVRAGVEPEVFRAYELVVLGIWRLFRSQDGAKGGIACDVGEREDLVV